VQKVTQKCVAEELKVKLAPEISANCKTGSFTTFYGQIFRFIGRNARYDPAGSGTEYFLTAARSKEPLDGSNASGYDVALGQFKALCPNRVR
jgi:hypothetical protein